jgi:hypothetical protein
MRALVVGLVLVARVASGAIVWMSSLEGPDSGTLGTSADSLECTVTQPGSDASAGLDDLTASPVAVPHNGRNGGHATSRLTFRVNTTSGNAGYCEVGANTACTGSGTPYACCTGSGTGSCAFAGLTQGAIGWHMHQNGTPAVAYIAAEVLETSSRTRGCFARVNTDRTLTVCYNDCATGANFGTTAATLRRDFCTGGACTTDADCSPDKGLCDTTAGTCSNVTRACAAATQATDCPSGQTCATCSTTTGHGCYHPGLELVQVNQGSRLLCELWMDGQKVISGAPTALAPGAITAFRFGHTNGAAGTVVASFDDIVITSDDRAGYGYVAAVMPTSDGPEMTCVADTCGGGSTMERCVDDWENGSTYDGTGLQGTMQCRSGKVGTFSRLRDGSGNGINPGQLSVPAVQTVVAGRTGGNDTAASGYGIFTRLLLCSAVGTCEHQSASEHESVVPFQTSTHREIDRALYATTPDAAATTWNAETLSRLGIRIRATAPDDSHLRVGALTAYVRVRRPDQPPPITLRDHDLGPNDGVVTVCTNGDSTNGGTFSVTCQGGANAGAACSQDSYCADFYATRDKPFGGCDATDAVCQTCQNRRAEFGGGAGYPCGPNNQTSSGVNGTCNLGTCSGGFCTGDTSVACPGGDGDCDLGNCDTCSNADCTSQTPASTCIESCPDGVCPTNRTAWGDFLTGTTCPDGSACSIGADNIIRSAVGSETSTTFASGRDMLLLQGRDLWAVALTGSGGSCECSTGADCGSGGACTNGLCTAGDANKVACQSSVTCNIPGGLYCRLPQCDYVIWWEGINDTVSYGGNPDCTGVLGVRGDSAVDNGTCNLGCPRMACLADSTCTTDRAADSECIAGQYLSGLRAGDPCTQSNSVSGTCSVQTQSCNVTADCPASFTCTGGTPNAPTHTGYCDCGADADPGPCSLYDGGGLTFACRANVCRRKCTADNQCGTGLTCPAGSPRVCQGRCTCPCDSDDIPGFPNADNCTTDADCTPRTISDAFLSRAYQGSCIEGKCRCCGSVSCRDGTCDAQADRWQGQHGHHVLLDAIAQIKANMAALNTGDTDGGPVWIWSTLSPTNEPECSMTHGPVRDQTYVHKVNQHLLTDTTTYPHVLDMAGCEAMSGYAKADLYEDNVHPGTLLAAILGGCAVQKTQSLNVCATQAGTPWSTAQRYCRSNAGAWTTRTCTENASCRAQEVCAIRGCGTCTCSGASDCAASGGTCTSGQCVAGDAARTACTKDDDCASGKTCTFDDANCPASGDSCNEE